MKSKQKYKRTVHGLRYGIAAFAVMAIMSMVLIGTASAADIYVGSGGSIQGAIDGANSDDTIYVAAGTYTEQILIQKSINLIGVGEETTFIMAPTTRIGTVTQGSTWDYIVAAYPTTGTIDVRIEGFTIDADSQPMTSGTAGLIGVFFRDVSGTNAGLYSSTIQGFSGTAYESWGVGVYGNSDLTIDDNTLTDYTRDGIVVNGDDGLAVDPDVVVSNNDLTGRTDTYAPLNGIQIAYGATGTISGNTVRDHTRSSAWAAVGIIVFSSDGITVSGNTVQNCHNGILLTNSDGSIVSGNTLTENIAFHIGLDDSDNNQVSGNTITGTATGIEDKAIGLSNGATGNIIGGSTPADGNTIDLLTSAYTGHTPLQYVIYIQSSVGSGSNIIQNNVITGGKRAVQIDGGNTGTTTISDNTISNPSWGGISLNGGNSVISGNTLTNTVRPIEFQSSTISVTISDNVIDGSTFDGINCGWASGTITIAGNEIYNIPQYYYAIHGRMDADNIVIDNNEISQSYTGIKIDSGCTDVQITNNYIHDNGWSAMELHETVTMITGNTLINNWRGIETWSPIIANYNNILSHAYGGVILHHTGPHNAEFNWWGDASGPSGSVYPGTGTSIVDNGNTIDYSPWLGFTVVTTPMTWHTNDNIRDTIDEASDGDTIIVVAGTYNEGITIIDKDLTIVGDAFNKPIINPTTDTGIEYDMGPNCRGWFQIHNGATVTFKNLVFDGTGKLIHTAVHYYGDSAGGTVENCDFMNIKYDKYNGRGINNYGQHVDVLDCTFTDIQRIGVFTYGSSPSTMIKGCTYTGKGDGDWLDYGIEFGGGGSGTVDGCDISACTGVASLDDSTSAGILATDYYGTGTSVTVVNSILTGNTDGIAVGYDPDDATMLTAHCNDISGNIEYGILNVGIVEVDAENNWWGDASGPTHSSNSGGIGDAVSDNVDFDPWLTYDQLTSSLTYTGAPQPMTAVVLEATLADSTSTGISDVEVDFYLDGDVVGSGITDSDGVATLDITTYPVGVYDVFASVNCLESEHALLAVYDPSAGFVTGGGWIDSPPGAYYPDTSLTGKANFGFVSKYKKGADTPTGTTQFKFKVADFNFHSESYDWLVIAGEHAKYKGTGTINGDGEYGFMLTAIDGDFLGTADSDKFWIKIWDKATETVVYDNNFEENDDTVYDGTELGGGSIVIHKAK